MNQYASISLSNSLFTQSERANALLPLQLRNTLSGANVTCKEGPKLSILHHMHIDNSVQSQEKQTMLQDWCHRRISQSSYANDLSHRTTEIQAVNLILFCSCKHQTYGLNTVHDERFRSCGHLIQLNNGTLQKDPLLLISRSSQCYVTKGN